MRRREMGLVLAAAIIAALVPAGAAQAAPRCFGRAATIVGTGGNDRLVGTPGPDVIVGRSGTDLIKGRGGKDRICGGSGEDTLNGGGGNDRVSSGGGDQSGRGSVMFGGGGNDLLRGNDFAGESMHGGPGHDKLHAFGTNRTYDDLLDGGPGDDELLQEQGPSTLRPGPGNDSVNGAAADISAEDPISPSDDVDFLDLRSAPGPLVVDLAARTASGEGSDQVRGVEVVIGGSFDDSISGGGTECCVRGDIRPINETLYGMGGDDVLAGGEGDDCLVGDPTKRFDGCFSVDPTGESGNDLLLGGGGNDVMLGMGGDDRYVGGPGDDTVSFGESTTGVTADLGTGQATGEGNDTLEMVERLVGSPFEDSLTGGEGDNLLDGGRGSDSLSGGGGNDTLRVLFGDAGGSMDGGVGSDTVTYDCQDAPRDVDVDLLAGTDSFGNTLAEVENVDLGDCRGTAAGDDGPNRLIGGRSGDQLSGRGGDDIILAAGGDDLLDGGEGNDILDGGEGIDSCLQGETLVRCE